MIKERQAKWVPLEIYRRIDFQRDFFLKKMYVINRMFRETLQTKKGEAVMIVDRSIEIKNYIEDVKL